MENATRNNSFRNHSIPEDLLLEHLTEAGRAKTHPPTNEAPPSQPQRPSTPTRWITRTYDDIPDWVNWGG